MSTLTAAAVTPLPTPQGPGAPAGRPRVASVDALRALVMFTMLFVNDVAGVRGTPWWMLHYPAAESGMTFVDLVFPAFLFLVGMSVPLALRRHLECGVPTWRLVVTILTRGASLLLIGVLMVNMPASGERIGWPGHLWEVLTFAAVLLAFHSVPAMSPAARRLSLAVRLAGFAGIAYLSWIYRGKSADHLRTSWWGILGLIGWAYMISALLYLALRRSTLAMLGAAASLLSLWVLDKHGFFRGLAIRQWVSGSHLGSHPGIAMAGTALASLLVGQSDARRRFTFAGLLAAGSAIAAVAMHGYGINKNAATPSWCFWTICVGTLLWAGFHALLDLRAAPPKWAVVLTHAGGNALLAYVASALIYHLLPLTGATFYTTLGTGGLAVGIARSLLFATGLLAFCGLLDRLRIRLKV